MPEQALCTNLLTKTTSANFTRKWFAWANTLFGEFVWKVYREKPQLLS